MSDRLKVLLAVHLVLGISPAAMFLYQGGPLMLPLIWSLSSIPLGQVMLLAIWAGLGASTTARRWMGTLAGVAYLATWPSLAPVFSHYTEGAFATVFVRCIAVYATLALLLTGMFLLVRRQLAELVRADDPELLPQHRLQFSILHVLIVTSVFAIILGLARTSTRADVAGTWSSAVAYTMMIVVYGTNLVMTAWAALSPGRPHWRLAVAFAVAIVLGMIISYTALYRLPTPESQLWLFCMQTICFAIPPLIVAASLLVVRSTGYRLVPKSVATEWRRRDIDSNQSLNPR